MRRFFEEIRFAKNCTTKQLCNKLGHSFFIKSDVLQYTVMVLLLAHLFSIKHSYNT